MKKNVWISINQKDVAPVVKKNSALSKALAKEAENGIETQQFPITGFKVEQKIVNMVSDGSLNIGIFSNGESKIKQLQTVYFLSMFSNHFQVIQTPDGKEIRKRYGYGYGFTLSISDIRTKINFNYAIIAASAALRFLKASYELNVYGVKTPALIQHLPSTTGGFNAEIYDSLVKFIAEAKKQLSSGDSNVLYPIEVLGQSSIKLESSDNVSIYFATKKISEGVSLQRVIDLIRVNRLKINENVVQYIYKYFGQNNAYVEPGVEQKRNAKNWIGGKFNKVESNVDPNGHWVAIDPATENGKFLVFSGMAEATQYQPHPLPADWRTLAKTTDDKFTEVSLDFSSAFKLASIVDTSAKFNTTTITRDISYHFDVADNGIDGSEVWETRYGVGIRLTLRISEIEFGTEVNYATIGAVSELGHANVEYEISGYGISDPSILKVLPGPQTVNQDTIKSINQAFSDVKTKFSSLDESKLTPQPLMIRVKEPNKIDPTLEAQALVFAYTKAADRAKLKDAVSDAAKVGIDQALVRKFYSQKFNVSEMDDRPNQDSKRNAKRWLDL